MTVYAGAPARLGESRLPDGRLPGWAEWGPPDGVPVLLCPGAATSRWLGSGADVVEALGVRLASVDRPGLGASTPAPGRDFSDFADDMRRLCAIRGLGDAGAGTGAPGCRRKLTGRAVRPRLRRGGDRPGPNPPRPRDRGGAAGDPLIGSGRGADCPMRSSPT
ncbi:hypothetical protein GCM10010389_20120 [Streptomyces echinoruber]|uniref:AB hydrolase-1 domain-containing protein n=1 Tax=Streptomyces echinoruber TaxID=68898 RepID=A0A918V8T3_9ACTN|nr:hypothetical protein GCM10010389_20120 [Streptomyces echinoruber]